MCGFLSFKHGRNYFFASFSARASQTEPRSSAVKKPSFSLELYYESTNEKGRPEVYTLSPPVNGSTPNTLQVLNELLPELSPAYYDNAKEEDISDLPAAEENTSTTESVN